MNRPRLDPPAANAARASCVSLAAILLAVGCGSDGTTSPARADAGSDAEVIADTVVYEATVEDFVTRGPVAGAEVCVLDADPADCVTTDADGWFSMDLPAHSDVALRCSADEYQSALRFIETSDFDTRGSWLFAKVADIDAILSADAALDWDRDKGAIAIFVGSDGVEASLEPESGDLFYLLANGAAAFDDGTGTPEPSYVIFLNVEPGEYELSLDDDGGTCMHSGWATERDDTQRLSVRADHLTSLLSANCLR